MSADTSTTLEQAATGSHPEHLQGYRDPVVRVTTKDKQHEPDWTADEPQPACGAEVPQHRNWIVEERDTERREQCHHQDCGGNTCSMQGGTPRYQQEAVQDDHQLESTNRRWLEAADGETVSHGAKLLDKNKTRQASLDSARWSE